MKREWRKCKNQLTKPTRIQDKTYTIVEMKNTLEGINSRITEAEGQINELEDRMVEITAKEKN